MICGFVHLEVHGTFYCCMGMERFIVADMGTSVTDAGPDEHIVLSCTVTCINSV